MKGSIKTQRLFFALWPNESVRKSIAETLSQLTTQQSNSTSTAAAESVQAQWRVIHPQNLHVTLHFIGQATAQTRDCMHRAAQTLSSASLRGITKNALPVNKTNSFRFVLDSIGHFPKAKILWMGAQDTPAELIKLQRNLGSALKSCGYDSESRIYKPHVTLLRKYNDSSLHSRGAQTEFSIPWQVDDFVLVESIPDVNSGQGRVNYQVVEKYPLA